MMNNPTCPQCQQPLTARDAMPFMGQVAILLECDYWHQTVEIVPVSRFTLTKEEQAFSILSRIVVSETCTSVVN